MTGPKRIPIYYKIVALVLSLILALGCMLGLVLWESLETLMNEQLEKRGVEIASHIASLSTNPILVDDRYALFELVHETQSTNDDVRYILISNYAGNLLAHTFPEGLPSGLLAVNTALTKNDATIARVNTNEGLIRDVLLPIEMGSVGYVRVGISETNAKGIIGRTIKKMLAITAVVCGAALLLTTRVARMITTPVSSLVTAATNIACGNLQVRAPVRTRDEIGELAAAFNSMAISLVRTNGERDQLVQMLQEKEELRSVLLNKVFSAQEEERKRISRELHDETSQALTSLIVSMRVLADKQTNASQRELLLQAREVAAQVLQDIRYLAVELRPTVLDDLGLAAAMAKYASKYQERFGMVVNFETNGGIADLNSQIALALYRIMQESLTNIAKHAMARMVRIKLELQQEEVWLSITDDGCGIGAEDLDTARRDKRLGIYGMRERAELLGGVFEFQSNPGTGTSVRVIIPISDKEL